MVERSRYPLIVEGEEDALSIIIEGTAKVTGEAFFTALVENLSKALNTHSAWITEYIEATRQLRALAFWADGQLRTDFIIDSEGTPCGDVIENDEFVHHPDNIVNIYPKDDLLKELKAASYMGIPLRDTEQKILGHLAVLDTDPLPQTPRTLKIFQIFAARASAELQRLRAEQNLRKREEKYRRVFCRETNPGLKGSTLMAGLSAVTRSVGTILIFSGIEIAVMISSASLSET